MVLEGTVTNVTNFGAFVDIGVHQDGLVHISALAERFVKDPHEVVKSGDLVKVKVMEVDLERKRIALSMRLGEPVQPGGSKAQPAPGAGQGRSAERPPRKTQPRGAGQERPAAPPAGVMGGALADAFAKARKP